MTVSNTSGTCHTRKKSAHVKLQLTGSQINLSPRPIPNIHLAWSPYRTFPMRRSISAFGFQQTDEEHSQVNRRPLSADNIRYPNKKKFTNDFHSQITVSSSSQDFDKACCISSDNVFENIINDYSENKKLNKNLKNSEISLKPGLLSKPPLPPDQKPPTPKPETEMEIAPDGWNIKTAAEKEAFDEIIALKFQRWFPNSSSLISEYSSSEGEANDVEFLTYKERNYQTCEYKYEVVRKNPKKDDKKQQNLFKCRPKGKKPILKAKGNTAPSSSSPISSTSTHSSKVNHQDVTITEIRKSPIHDNSPSPKLHISRRKSNENEVNENSINILEEQDNKRVTEKLKASAEEKVFKSETADGKLKNLKTSFLKKSNSQSPLASPFKKPKKISFSVDSPGRSSGTEEGCTGSSNNKTVDNFVEPYFSVKNSHDSERKTVSAVEKANVKEDNGNVVQTKGTTSTVPAMESKVNNRDMMVSPQQPAGSQIEDVLSWMSTLRSTGHEKLAVPEVEANHSMYDEIVDILKDIEKEDIKDHTKVNEVQPTKNVTPSSPARAIWSLLEEAEKNDDIITNVGFNNSGTDNNQTRDIHTNNNHSSNTEEVNKHCWNRLSDLLRIPSTELAQKVMALQLLLDERETSLQNLNARIKNVEQAHQQRREELEYSVHKQQKLIEQLKNEKKHINDKLENAIREMEKKHAAEFLMMEERSKVELKKCLEKQAAADKIEREKWMETKTQKIKELAIKSLQPELSRIAAAHEEEIAEIRKFHKRQIEEIEEGLNRRMLVQKEKMESEREKALAIEREISRQKLEDEIGELEKRYQEQRKRLLAEVHVERESMERQNEATLAIKEKEGERKWEKKAIEMQKKIDSLQAQHQEEIQKLQQNFEAEKQIWIKNQMIELSEKENKIKEQYKKERDKHIELIIQKLESENSEKDQANEQKIKRLKEQYEAEIRDMEIANENFRRKLNESRSEIQRSEDTVSQLRTQLNQTQTEFLILKEKYDRLMIEQGEIQNIAKSELSTRVHILQSELNQAHLTYESQIKSLRSDNERELSQMYNRVRETITKKDELINSLKKQKDAALEQCSQLEKLLESRRKEHLRS